MSTSLNKTSPGLRVSITTNGKTVYGWMHNGELTAEGVPDNILLDILSSIKDGNPTGSVRDTYEYTVHRLGH